MKKLDLTGNVYGKLTVIRSVKIKESKASNWECLCECGNTAVIALGNLRRKKGGQTSCGCMVKTRMTEWNNKNNPTHLESKTPLYHVWADMKQRCYNKNSEAYYHYGAKGITVCDEWISSYEAFRDWAKDNGYSSGLSIDRIKGRLGYFPSNCRWVTRTAQARNKVKTQNKHTSNYIGITKQRNKWRAKICVNGEDLVLGYFYHEQEAITARDNFIINNKLKYFNLSNGKPLDSYME